MGKWDAESVLSLRCNHENHPTEIEVTATAPSTKRLCTIGEEKEEMEQQPQQQPREQEHFAFGTIGNGKDTLFVFDDIKAKARKEEDEDEDDEEEDIEADAHIVTAFSNRKGESREQRKIRKALKKTLKQQRRREKKANKEAFKVARKKGRKLRVTQSQSHSNALRL